MFTHIRFTVVPVSDQDRALAFYTRTLGFTVFRDSRQSKDSRWIELELPGAQTRLLFGPRQGTERTAAPAMILVTPDVEATHAALVAAGVAFTAAPQRAPWKPKAMYAVLVDSENNLVMIEEPYGREAL